MSGTGKPTDAATRRGYFAVGIMDGKSPQNIGTLWRSAACYGAAFVFTVGRRYKRGPGDTPDVSKHTPLWHFDSVDDLKYKLPDKCNLIGVEVGDERGRPLTTYTHPERAAYLLGAEDHGLDADTLKQCWGVIEVETELDIPLNVSTAGSIVCHDRMVKMRWRL